MKALLLFLILGNLALSQQTSEPQMTAVAYIYSYKYYESDIQPRQENMNLLIDGQESSFQSYNLRKMDTIISQNKSTDINDPAMLEARRKYRYNNTYNIHIKENDVEFHSRLGTNEFVYDEELQLGWDLKNDSTQIMGHDCKNATIIYGGRQWEAWYAPDLPFNAGPYKFKGLPGLILKVTDSTGDFDFEARAMGVKSKAPLEKSFFMKSKDDVTQTSREEFNEMKSSYEALSFNEKMNYMMPGSDKVVITKMWDKDGNEESLRKLDQTPEKRIFLEIDK